MLNDTFLVLCVIFQCLLSKKCLGSWYLSQFFNSYLRFRREGEEREREKETEKVYA